MFQFHQQQESIVKCCQQNHNNEPALHICIRPNCKFAPLCCKFCIKEMHQNHQFEEFIPINDINIIDSLNQSQVHEQFNLLQNTVQIRLKEIASLLDQLDIVKQFQQNPSVQILNNISYILKNKTIEKMKNILCSHIQSLKQEFDEITSFIIKFKEVNIDEIHLSEEQLYQKGVNLFQRHEDKNEEVLIWMDRVLEINQNNKQALFVKAESLQLILSYNQKKNRKKKKAPQFKQIITFLIVFYLIITHRKYYLYLESSQFHELGRYYESIEYADLILNMDPDYLLALQCKGAYLLLSKLNRYE